MSRTPALPGASVSNGIGIPNTPRSMSRSWPDLLRCTFTRARFQNVWPEFRTVQGSRRQVAEQPSPPTAFPSSHSSPTSRTPLPHASSRQVAEQPSPPTVFPSSHSSPTSRSPLPHASSRQVAEQPSPPTVSPSSHSSPTSRTPLPHASSRQVAEQPSPPAVF